MKNIKAIAIGGFDGMHVGHQQLFEALGNEGAILVIETGYANLTPAKAREHYTDLPIFYYELDDIRHLDAEGFIAKLLEEFPNLEKIVVGYDFHFGKDRCYNYDDLRELFSGKVEVISEVKIDDDSVHSHKIRKLLEQGKLEQANLYLGYNYQLKGRVIPGQGVGKEKLVPTLNLDVRGYRLPKEGVYATLTRLDDDHLYPSVSFIGQRTITDGSFAIETHILDSDIKSSQKADISFLHFIRKNRSFDSFEALKDQIDKDIKEAKQVIHLLEL